ncbi:MAG: hypothetical protein IH935_00580 [Acidobacteria bacterium]|nr:hypothetical protein [Acidobacteriota bacterium]
MKNKKIWLFGLLAGLLAAAATVLFLVPGSRPARPDLDLRLALLRLLPAGSDLYAMADLVSLQASPVVRKLLTQAPRIPREQEYEDFVRATGFSYGRDLKRLALAKSGPDWVGAAQVALDRPQITAYIESLGAVTTKEMGQTVFTFGQSRPFRLVLLDHDLVGFSVGGDMDSIRQVLQRHAGDIAASAAAEIEEAHDLDHIPAGSSVWAVGRLEKLLNADGEPPPLGSFELGGRFLEGSETLYLSVHPVYPSAENGPAQLRFQLEAQCDSAASAERIANSVQGILALLRFLPSGESETPEKKFSSLLAGISVEHRQESVFLRWEWDESVLSFLEPNASPASSP